MLKPDDSAWTELVAEIKAVVSSRSEDGFAFVSMHRTEQWDFFTTSGFYSPYMDRGMTETQISTVVRNAINGKPQEEWLDGVFDPVKAPTQTLAEILAGSGHDRMKERIDGLVQQMKTPERDGMER
ncbi:MAG: hypothetical protein NTW75_00430 [Planctomycetales bacterium]|nr:hypothetical protein [Planctomycetales bacterium]